MYHVMDADGVRQDAEWERMKEAAGAELRRHRRRSSTPWSRPAKRADQEAVDLYAFTSVLKRHLDAEARIEFIGLMWEIVYADGELHELEDTHALARRRADRRRPPRPHRWRRQQAQAPGAGATGQPRTNRSLMPRPEPAEAENPGRAASGDTPAPAASAICCWKKASISTSGGRRSATRCPKRWTSMPAPSFSADR